MLNNPAYIIPYLGNTLMNKQKAYLNTCGFLCDLNYVYIEKKQPVWTACSIFVLKS